MEIEMSIKGLRIDPITNMPIVVLRETGGRARAADLGRRLRGQRDRAADRERADAAPDDARSAQERDRRASAAGVERIVVCDLKDNTFYATIQRADGARAPDRRRAPLGRDRPRAARSGARIFVEEAVIQSARSMEDGPAATEDVGRLQRWLEKLSDDDLGKYKM